ncbi:MAG: PAS domain S-box protein, partial [Candidatus Sulfotelmatobacter sp.]
MVTALTLVSVAPKAISLPGLQVVNHRLEEQISERRQAEAEREQVLKDLADQKFALDQHAIVATTDVRGTITYVNDKFCAISQYSRAELIGQNPRVLDSAYHSKEFFQQMYETIAGGKVWRGEICNRAKNGSIYWVETTIVPFLDPGGKPRQYMAIGADTTERKRAEQARGWLAAIVESSEDAIISKDLQGTITAWNRGAEKVFGYSTSEAIGKPMLMLIPPERANEESDILDRIRRGESVKHFETVRVRKDGTRVDISEAISPIRDASGAIVGASKIARDITQRKQAEAARQLAEERYRRFVERTAAGVLRNTLDGRILESNDAMVRMLGYGSRAEFLSRPHPEIHYVNPEERRLLVERLKENGALNNYEACFQRKDGKPVWVVMSLVLVKGEDEDGDVLEATVIDVTERKQAEQRLSEQAEELSRQSLELLRSQQSLEEQARMLKLVMDSMGEGLIAADPNGHFLLWNDSADRLMGRGATDLATEQWTPHYKVFLPDGITPSPARDLPLVRALRGEPVQVELIVEQNEPGSRVCLEVTARPMKDAEGALCGGVAVLRDITERKRAEEVLARQAEQLMLSQRALETQTLMLQSVLDSIGEGLVAADETGKFILWNPAATKIVGMGAANVPPELWTDHYGTYLPDTVTPFPPEQNPLLRAIRGEACTVEMYVRNTEHETGVWIESSGNPLKNSDGASRGGVVAFRDVTQRRIDEREIRKLNDELEEKVAQRTRQLEAANHELE